MKVDFGQDTLFGKKVISTIGYNEQEIIRDILYLHANNKPIDCDPTYSTGHFYKDWAIPPKYKFDKFPQVAGVIEATSDNLPLDPNSVEVIMFDPPFVMTRDTYGEAQKGSSIIAKRFTGFHNFDELKQMYSGSLKEFARVLMGWGIVIFKCQDCVVCSLNHFTHSWVMFEAMKYGFYPKDLFILLARNRLTDGRVQQHARKFHSYFWVFKKSACKINYKES